MIPARPATEERAADHRDAEHCRYLLIGEAPGQLEEQVGFPFVGGAGGLLDKAIDMLVQEGLTKSSVYYTYAVRERQPDDKRPSMKIKREHMPYLENDITLLSPDAIVVLGGQALSAILDVPTAAVGPQRLKVSEFMGVPMMVTFHPSAVHHDRTKAQDFLDDLYAYMVQEIWDPEKQKQEKVPVRLVNNPDHLQALWVKVAAHDLIGLDIETVGFTAKIVTIGLYLGDTAYVIPLYHDESLQVPAEILAKIRDLILLDPDKIVVGQNIKFDLARLQRASGARVVKCLAEDAMLYHHMLNEHSTQRNLDYLSRAYSPVGGYKEEFHHDFENLSTAPLRALARYNGTDAAIPVRIVAELRAQLAAKGELDHHLEELSRRISPFVAMVEAAGIAVDQARLGEVEESLTAQRSRVRRALEGAAPGINPDSPRQLATYLFTSEGLGLAVPDIKDAVGKSGQPSTREEVLKLLPPSEYLDLLLEYRGLQKLLRTYVKQLRQYKQPIGVYDERTVMGVRPEYFVAKTDWGGTVTGRLSAKRPAIQTIPKGSEIRSAFVPRRAEGAFVAIDADQMELRVAAQESQDGTLLDVFRTDSDPHQATADLCGVTRSEGKTINFACIYGASTPKLVELGLPLRTAQRVTKTLRSGWARLYEYFGGVKGEAARVGQVRTGYGRIRRLPGATTVTAKGRALLREAANFVIQAPASDIIQLLGHDLSLRLEGRAVPILSNHDGLVFDVGNKSDVDLVLHIMREAIDNLPALVEEVLGLTLTVPIKFSAEVGDNLLEMEETDL
jgi:DNA polymerase-1